MLEMRPKETGTKMTRISPGPPLHRSWDQSQGRSSNDELPPIESVGEHQSPPLAPVAPVPEQPPSPRLSADEQERPDFSGGQEGWQGPVDGQEPEGSFEGWRSTIGQTDQAWLHNQFGVPVGMPPAG
jgi:hypothetical protein